MERRDFLFQSTILGGALMVGCSGTSPNQEKPQSSTVANTLYVPPNEDRIKISYEQTGNQLTTVELKLPPKMCGPAPHIHEELDEIVRVLSGTLSVMVDEEIIKVPAGAWHFRPRKKIHGFWNETDEPVHFIEIYPNQNFDIMLGKIWALREDLKGRGISLDSKEAWVEVDKIQKQWGITMFHERRPEIIKKYGLLG